MCYTVNMYKIPRLIKPQIVQRLQTSSKAVILFGPRQVGKTTLVMNLLGDISKRPLIISADEQRYVDVFSSRDLNVIKSLVSGYDTLFLDEAQRVPDVGIAIKLMVDQIPGLKIIATGSSSFDLANQVAEPLTGRAWFFTLYPISISELCQIKNPYEINEQLAERLIFGSYPELWDYESDWDKQKYLQTIRSAYLYRDILSLADVKHASKLEDLLKLLAFQIGSEVSLSELASSLQIGKETVDRYINLLEKSFIVFRRKGFSRNLRKEITKMDKIYFYDLGIRNVLIDNLKNLQNRDDIGKLWENFLMVERKKYMDYTDQLYSPYFWRTYTGAEIDYVEEQEGKLTGFEFKYNAKRKKAPATFLEVYPNSKFFEISRENYLDFIS